MRINTASILGDHLCTELENFVPVPPTTTLGAAAGESRGLDGGWIGRLDEALAICPSSVS